MTDLWEQMEAHIRGLTRDARNAYELLFHRCYHETAVPERKRLHRVYQQKPGGGFSFAVASWLGDEKPEWLTPLTTPATPASDDG